MIILRVLSSDNVIMSGSDLSSHHQTVTIDPELRSRQGRLTKKCGTPLSDSSLPRTEVWKIPHFFLISILEVFPTSLCGTIEQNLHTILQETIYHLGN